MGDKAAVIFDLDGTLIDAFRDIQEAINRPLVARGVAPHSLDQIVRWVGDGAFKLAERATPPHLMDQQKQIFGEMMLYYRDHPADHAVLYPGVIELLKGLQADRIPIGVLSNKPYEMCVKTCAQLGLMPFVDVLHGHTETAPRKPDPEALRSVMADLGVTRAVMVGDGVPDGEVSQAAGVPFIACLWGSRTREQLAEFAPVAWADSVAELGPLIRKLLT